MTGTILRMRYEIMQELDTGPIFTLYRARDIVSKREVFVRVLRKDMQIDPLVGPQIKMLVRTLTSILSPGVERFIEAEESDDTFYVLSEGPNGEMLSDRIRRLAPYSIPVCISLGSQILEGLAAIHMAGIAHGELTSNNVLVTSEGKTLVLQPGLWTVYGMSPTAGGRLMPMLAPYLAPEVTQGKLPSPASDVYGVGIMMFELLTGRLPFQDETPTATAQKHLTAPVPNMQALNSAIPPPLEELVRKALSKDVEARYPNAKAMLNDLRVMQDALKFGKALVWPIQSREAVTEAPPKPAEPVVAKPASKAPSPTFRSRDEEIFNDKLPMWISIPGYLAVMAIIVIVAGYIYFNVTRPRSIQVPNLVGQSLSDAKPQLESIGLRLRTSREEYNEKKPEGVILSLSPAPGNEVREGASVSAVVSAGSRMVSLPDLRGRKLEEARRLLEALDLKIGENPEEKRSRNFPPGTVIEQIPDPRSKVERETIIRVVVASNRNAVTDPNANVVAEYALEVTIPRTLSAGVILRVDRIDLDGTQTVLSDAEYSAGQVALVETKGRGSQVIFKIFFDGQLVKQVTGEPSETE